MAATEGFDAKVDLYWIPLGAGARVVRFCGRTYEAGAAIFERRRPRPLFHSALVADTPSGRVFVEMAPIPSGSRPADRGVVAEGAVGLRSLGRFRVFRYEIRRWVDGSIPDLASAIGDPVRITSDPALVDDILGLLAAVPTPVWGRDELEAGEMWNSNSVVSWVLAQADVLDAAGEPPLEGRAPGWRAGVAVARRRGAGAASAPAAV